MLRVPLDRATLSLVAHDAITRQTSAPALIRTIVRHWYGQPLEPGDVTPPRRRAPRAPLSAA